MTPNDPVRSAWTLTGRALISLLLLAVAWLSWDIAADERVRGLAINTLQMVFGSIAVAVPIGTLLALLLVRTDLPAKKFTTLALTILLMVPLYLQAAAWESGWGRLGWYTMSPDNPQEPLLTGLAAVVWIHGIAGIPWVTLIVAAALWYSDSQLEDEALLDASSLRVVGQVTLRRAAVAILVAALWVGVRASAEIAVTDLYRYRSYSEEFYTQLALSESVSFDNVWRFVLPPLFLVLVCSLGMLNLARRIVPPVLTDWLQSGRQFQLQAWRWPIACCVGLLLLVIVGCPLGSLIYKCGQVVVQSEGERLRSWSLFEFAQKLGDVPVRYRQEFQVTLLLGIVSSSCALAIAIPLSWWARMQSMGNVVVGVIVAIGLAVPAPLLGLSILRLFRNHLGDVGRKIESTTIASPVLTLTLRVLPLVIMCCWSVLRTIPKEQFDAAATEGANTFGRLIWIALPQRVVMWVSVWFLGLVWSCGELSASIVVMPPQLKSTIPILLFGKIHMGVRNEESALCLVMIGTLCLLAVAIMAFGRAKLPLSRSWMGEQGVAGVECSEERTQRAPSALKLGARFRSSHLTSSTPATRVRLRLRRLAHPPTFSFGNSDQSL